MITTENITYQKIAEVQKEIRNVQVGSCSNKKNKKQKDDQKNYPDDDELMRMLRNLQQSLLEEKTLGNDDKELKHKIRRTTYQDYLSLGEYGQKIYKKCTNIQSKEQRKTIQIFFDESNKLLLDTIKDCYNQVNDQKIKEDDMNKLIETVKKSKLKYPIRVWMISDQYFKQQNHSEVKKKTNSKAKPKETEQKHQKEKPQKRIKLDDGEKMIQKNNPDEQKKKQKIELSDFRIKQFVKSLNGKNNYSSCNDINQNDQLLRKLNELIYLIINAFNYFKYEAQNENEQLQNMNQENPSSQSINQSQQQQNSYEIEEKVVSDSNQDERLNCNPQDDKQDVLSHHPLQLHNFLDEQLENYEIQSFENF